MGEREIGVKKPFTVKPLLMTATKYHRFLSRTSCIEFWMHIMNVAKNNERCGEMEKNKPVSLSQAHSISLPISINMSAYTAAKSTQKRLHFK